MKKRKLNSTNPKYYTVKDEEGNDISATHTIYGSQFLDTSDLSAFTAFSDLTASDVQGWVEEAIGADKITEMKDGLDATIAELVTPTQQTKIIG